MKLSNAPAAYSQPDQTQVRSVLEREDGRNYKRGQDVTLQPGQRLILPDSVTGDLYRAEVVSGVWTLTAL